VYSAPIAPRSNFQTYTKRTNDKKYVKPIYLHFLIVYIALISGVSVLSGHRLHTVRGVRCVISYVAGKTTYTILSLA